MKTFTFRLGKTKLETRAESPIVEVVARTREGADLRLAVACFPRRAHFLYEDDHVNRYEVHFCRPVSAPAKSSYIKKSDL